VEDLLKSIGPKTTESIAEDSTTDSSSQESKENSTKNFLEGETSI
jgi:hypothetical protein